MLLFERSIDTLIIKLFIPSLVLLFVVKTITGEFLQTKSEYQNELTHILWTQLHHKMELPHSGFEVLSSPKKQQTKK